MDGLSRACGSPAPVRLLGKTWLLEPLTLRRLGSIEAWLISHRDLPTDKLKIFQIEGMSQEIFDRLQEQAIDEIRSDPLLRIVTSDELHDYLWTEEGIQLSSFLCLKPNQPEVFGTLEATIEILNKSEQIELERLLKVRGMISGIDLLSQMDWRSNRFEKTGQTVSRGQEKYEQMPWRRIFRKFAEERMSGPETWRDITLYELNMLTCGERDLGGVQKVDNPVEVQQLQREAGKEPKPVIVIGNNGKGVEEWKKMKAIAEARRKQQNRAE